MPVFSSNPDVIQEDTVQMLASVAIGALCTLGGVVGLLAALSGLSKVAMRDFGAVVQPRAGAWIDPKASVSWGDRRP